MSMSTAATARTLQHSRRQGVVLIVTLVTVFVVDQATKWWAWRNVSSAIINPGGDPLVSNQIGSWFENGALGGMLDVADAVFLATAAVLLVRRQRSWPVLLGGGLVLAGWSSNVADRLGLHSWTAPGSSRGAVDFLPYSQWVFNFADVVITAGTLIVVTYGLTLLYVPRPSTRTASPGVGRVGLEPTTDGL
jgi:lipoprotein signal peptidase